MKWIVSISQDYWVYLDITTGFTFILLDFPRTKSRERRIPKTVPRIGPFSRANLIPRPASDRYNMDIWCKNIYECRYLTYMSDIRFDPATGVR